MGFRIAPRPVTARPPLGVFRRLMQVLNNTRQEERYEKLIDSSMPKIYSTLCKRRRASPWRWGLDANPTLWWARLNQFESVAPA